MTPEPSHEQKHSSARLFGSRLRSVVIRSKREGGDEVMEDVANKKEKKKTPKQVLKAFELVADGGYVDVSQRNGVDRIGKKVNGVLYLGVTDDFGDIHYFPLDTFEEKIRSGWIVSVVERSDSAHNKDVENQDSSERVFGLLKRYFELNPGHFQKDGNVLTIDEISDEKIKIRFQMQGEPTEHRASIGLKQAERFQKTLEENFGIVMDTSASTPVGNPGDQPPLPDVTPPPVAEAGAITPENQAEPLAKTYDELLLQLGESPKKASLEKSRLDGVVAAGLQELVSSFSSDDESKVFIRQSRIQLVQILSESIMIRLMSLPWDTETKERFAKEFSERSLDDFIK